MHRPSRSRRPVRRAPLWAELLEAREQPAHFGVPALSVLDAPPAALTTLTRVLDESPAAARGVGHSAHQDATAVARGIGRGVTGNLPDTAATRAVEVITSRLLDTPPVISDPGTPPTPTPTVPVTPTIPTTPGIPTTPTLPTTPGVPTTPTVPTPTFPDPTDGSGPVSTPTTGTTPSTGGGTTAPVAGPAEPAAGASPTTSSDTATLSPASDAVGTITSPVATSAEVTTAGPAVPVVTAEPGAFANPGLVAPATVFLVSVDTLSSRPVTAGGTPSTTQPAPLPELLTMGGFARGGAADGLGDALPGVPAGPGGLPGEAVLPPAAVEGQPGTPDGAAVEPGLAAVAAGADAQQQGDVVPAPAEEKSGRGWTAAAAFAVIAGGYWAIRRHFARKRSLRAGRLNGESVAG